MKGLAFTCKHCGKQFVRRKDSQIYCSTACRVKAYRERHGLGEPDWDGMKRRSLGDQINTRTRQMSLELYELEQYKNQIETALHEFTQIGKYVNLALQPNDGKSWHIIFDENLIEFREFTTQEVVKIPIKSLKKFNLTQFNRFFNQIMAFRKHTEIKTIVSEWSALLQDIHNQANAMTDKYQIAKRHVESSLSAITGKPIPRTATEAKALIEAKPRALADGIKVTTGRELAKQSQKTRLQLNSPFNELLGDLLPLSFYGIIWGNSGTGKSTFALLLLKELSRFGKVAFFNAETEVSRNSPIYRLVQHTGAYDVPLISGSSVDDLEVILRQDLYQFVVIDSVSRLELTPQKMQQLRGLCPNRTIIGLMESNKDGSMFKGSNEWKHHANLMIKAERVTSKEGNDYAQYTVQKNQYGDVNNSIKLPL